MLQFNSRAIVELKNILDFPYYKDFDAYLKKHGVCNKIKGLRRWRKTGKITIRELLFLCNLCRFPLTLFVRSDKEEDNRIYRLYEEKNWKKITFSPEVLYHLIMANTTSAERRTCMGLKLSWRELKQGCYDSLYEIELDELLEFCNRKGIYLGDFLHDYNLPFPADKQMLPRTEAGLQTMMDIESAKRIDIEEQNEKYRREEKTLKENNAQLIEENNKVNGQNADLENENNELRSQIRSMQRQNISDRMQKSKKSQNSQRKNLHKIL